MIRDSARVDLPAILAIIEDAAQAYRGVIPADCWHEPYMPAAALSREIDSGVQFRVAEQDGRVVALMGTQDKGDVALVRHAYVDPSIQRSGWGTRLLRDAEARAGRPVLIGTWAAAAWAIDFYRRNGYALVPGARRHELLRTYWSIPERQVETSVVLADRRWFARETT